MTRLAKLEGRKSRPPLPRLVFTLDDHEQAGGVTGYRLGNVTILKLAGETAQQCLDRAFQLQPDATSAAALYAQECGQHASWSAPAETPSDALSAPENGPSGHATTKRG